MKAFMNESGVITIKAETSAESWALGQWSRLALIKVHDLERNEAFHFRGSMILIDGTLEEE